MANYAVNPNKRLLDGVDYLSTHSSYSAMHSHLKYFFSSLAMLFSTLVLAPLSLFFFARYKGHKISVDKFTNLSMYKFNYTHPTKPIAVSIGKLSFRPHMPTKADPYFLTMLMNNLEYKDTQCHCSMGFLEVTFWFFPVLFRVSCEPWVYSKVDDFRLYVYESSSEPWWVVRLRNNVVSTFLQGETVRLHNLHNKIFLNGIWGVTGTKGNSVTDQVEKPGMKPDQELDEVRVRAQIEEWQLVNMQERMYTFGNFDVEVRRSWVEDRGSIVIVAKDCRWTKLPSAYLREGSYRRSSWPWQAMIGFMSIPLELIAIFRNPLAATDLHIIRTDITYENFRLRDAEMAKQTAIKLRLSYEEQKKYGQWSSVAWDTFLSNIISACFPELGEKVKELDDELDTENTLPLDEDEWIEQEWIEYPSREGSVGVKKVVGFDNHPRAMN